MQPKIDFYYFR